MGSPKKPDPPDYKGAAEEQAAQSAANLANQTWANRPSQTTPWGSVSWDQSLATDPGTGEQVTQWVQNLNLTPEAQRALDAQMSLQAGRSELGAGMMSRAQNEFGNEVDWSRFRQGGQGVSPVDMTTGLPQSGPLGALPTAGQYTPENIQRQVDTSGAQQRGNVEDVRNRAEQAIWERATSRLDPQWQQRMGDSRASLVAQGLRPGDAAYNRERANLNRSRTDAYQTAMNEAIMGGGQEAARQFGMQLQGRAQDLGQAFQEGNFANSAAQQALAQQLGIGAQQFNQQAAVAGLDQTRQAQLFGQQAQQAALDQSRAAQMFGQNLQSSQYQTQLRQQDIAEELQRRGWSLNEINALISGQQVAQPNMPTFNPSGVAQPANLLGAAQAQGNFDQANAQLQNDYTSGMISGVSGLAGSAMRGTFGGTVGNWLFGG